MVEGRNIFVSGRTGTGKSWLTRQMIAACPRLLTYQTKPEDHAYPGVYFDGAVVGNHQLMLRWWKHCVEHGRRFRLVYRPQNPFDLTEFDRIANLVYACGDMTLVCEEIMHYLSAYDPRRPDPGAGVTRLLTAGRTRGLETWLLTQRPVQIPHVLTSQARLAYLFATHEPAEVIYIRQAFGSDAADKLGELKEHEHVRWTETGEVTVGKA